MTELTIFSAPKPFTDPHIGIIQRNAIQSWMRCGADRVILIGQEEGLSQAAEDYGVLHLTEVKKNQFGTPLISSIFELAREASSSELLVYVNADIIILQDFGAKIRAMSQDLERFLGVGHRWDLNLESEIEFKPGWADKLENRVRAKALRQRSFAIDYFIFPRSIYQTVPDFAVGRAGWDNWMIYHARERDWPVVDLSPSVKVIHQNHDYSHLPGGQIHLDMEESAVNVELGGGIQNVYSILDADLVYQDGQLTSPKLSIVRLLRKLELWISPSEPGGRRWALSRKIRRQWVKMERRSS